MSNHRAVHKLSQVFADLTFAEQEILGFEESERRHRALCFVRSSLNMVRNVVDNDIGKKLTNEEARNG